MTLSQPQNTARARKKPSVPVRIAHNRTWLSRSRHRILDYGCGLGQDVRVLQWWGMDAEGYDPHEPFGRSTLPEGVFDVVFCTYVVNVIDSREGRLQMLRDAWEYVAPEGRLLVTSRSKSDVNSAAKKGSWPPHNDGYWSREKRGMFQKGHTMDELLSLVGELGEASVFAHGSGFVGASVRKPPHAGEAPMVVGDVLDESSD